MDFHKQGAGISRFHQYLIQPGQSTLPAVALKKINVA
jgi:hypothetical protein